MQTHRIRLLALLSLLLLVASPVLAAELPQASGMGGQSLRPYWHVFIAYTIAIGLVFGWVLSIARRLRDVEKRLGE